MKAIVAGLILGFIGHQTDRYITDWNNTPIVWKRLVRYAIGVYLIMIVFNIIKHGFDFKEWEREAKDFILAAVSVGNGVSLAYALDNKYKE